MDKYGKITLPKITLSKMATALGGIRFYRVNGKDYDSIKETVAVLGDADICWDISHKGISASDILTIKHPNDVTLVFSDKTEMTVAEAIAKYRETII